MKNFAVKTYYVVKVDGKRNRRDPAPGAVLLEERIVFFKARNSAAVKSKAMIDAKAYCKSRHENIFGQVVKTVYTGVYDIFELFDEKIKDGTELFSGTEVRLKKPSRKTLIDEKLGRHLGKREALIRRKFRNADFG